MTSSLPHKCSPCLVFALRGNAYGFTLRLTRLPPRRPTRNRTPPSRQRLTLTKPGEALLSEWMAEHARVAFMLDDEPWLLEDELIRITMLPLNIADNFYLPTRALRAKHRLKARELPIV
ncbi:GIY-YIG nuclease family protein [Lentzea sp. NPDC042327]|uniref:GIY-YIG nuclease family protein n=1 Tax=Lentzea sp. NPDC042327 TaxID=3154801 RepID=UPI0034053234